MEKVLILLSTFNGEKYLETQIHSLLNQEYKDISIYIRDDGSTDKTVEILRSYEKAYRGKIFVVFGENVGSKNSFFTLMESVPCGYSYYAFCDQDDYWLPEKICHAVSSLRVHDNDEPLMYCSRLIISDDNLNYVGISPDIPSKQDYRRAFFSNVATGCTVVFNERARQIALHGRRCAWIHDHWLYNVVSFFGNVIVDKETFIQYRQHSSNQIGMKSSNVQRIWSKLKRVVKGDPKFTTVSSRAKCFLEIYNEFLTVDQYKYVENLAFYKDDFYKTLALAFSRNIKSNSPVDLLALRILVIFRKI